MASLSFADINDSLQGEPVMHRSPVAAPRVSARVKRLALVSSAFCVALLNSGSAVARTHTLPNIGSVHNCASTLPTFAGGHGNQSCAVTTPGFLASKLNSEFLRNKCPTGQALRGLLNNYCNDARNRRGSVWSASSASS